MTTQPDSTGPVKGHKIPAKSPLVHNETQSSVQTAGTQPAVAKTDPLPKTYTGLGEAEDVTVAAPPMTSSFPGKGAFDVEGIRRRMAGRNGPTPHVEATVAAQETLLKKVVDSGSMATSDAVHGFKTTKNVLSPEQQKEADANKAAREAERAAQKKQNDELARMPSAIGNSQGGTAKPNPNPGTVLGNQPTANGLPPAVDPQPAGASGTGSEAGETATAVSAESDADLMK